VAVPTYFRIEPLGSEDVEGRKGLSIKVTINHHRDGSTHAHVPEGRGSLSQTEPEFEDIDREVALVHVQHEAEYGTKLVEQVGKRATLTDHGRLFHDYARVVDGLTEDLRGALAEDSSSGSGSLVLAAGTTVGEFVLPPICVEFQCDHPDVRFKVLVVSAIGEVERAVRERRADLGFQGRAVSEPELTCSPFMEDEIVAIVPPGHALGERPELGLEDFLGQNLVLSEPSHSPTLRVLISQWFESAGIQPRSVFESNSFQGMKEAVRSGAGVAVVSRFVVRSDDASLHVIPIKAPPQRRFYMVWRTSGWESRLIRSFREFVLGRTRAKQ
jgi:DNA-binding transcriptional LysR family regulator